MLAHHPFLGRDGGQVASTIHELQLAPTMKSLFGLELPFAVSLLLYSILGVSSSLPYSRNKGERGKKEKRKTLLTSPRFQSISSQSPYTTYSSIPYDDIQAPNHGQLLRYLRPSASCGATPTSIYLTCTNVTVTSSASAPTNYHFRTQTHGERYTVTSSVATLRMQKILGIHREQITV